MSVKCMPAYCIEVSSEQVHFCRRILVDNGVTLLFDELRGMAEGSDGKTYFPVCRELPGPEGDNEIVGWSSEAEEEVVLE